MRGTPIAVLILGVLLAPWAAGAVPAGTAAPDADGAPAVADRAREWSPGNPVEVGAASAILIEAATGEVLYAKDARTRRPPASTTKIMTALLILERGRLQKRARVSHEAARVGGAGIGLRRGQRVALQDLLPAILLRSANDAAVVAAEHVGRTVEGFVVRMNARAKVLRMRDTHFMNPHGLDHPLHYSSAFDLALLARYALTNPTFARLVRKREARVRVEGRTRRGRARVRFVAVRTHNKLLGAYEGADGVKTGYTEQAGPSLVASAHRQGKRLLVVLLNDRDRWQDAANLFEYGFRSLGSRPRPPRPARARAVPGRGSAETSRGSHRLLREGAKLVEDWTDILPEILPQAGHLGPGRGGAEAPIAAAPRLEADEAALFALVGEDPVHIDELILGSGLGPGRVAKGLLGLAMRGLLRELPGKRFLRAPEGARVTGEGPGKPRKD